MCVRVCVCPLFRHDRRSATKFCRHSDLDGTDWNLKKGGREGGREGGEGGREGARERGSEGARERGREGGREGGR